MHSTPELIMLQFLQCPSYDQMRFLKVFWFSLTSQNMPKAGLATLRLE